MPELKPAYLVHGDDHGAVSERRAGLRALAEREGGADSVEALEGERATPAGVASALAAMTLAIGWRVILVDGVERWKQAEVQEWLVPALQAMPPDTTVALFAREEGRTKAPAAIHEAVKRAKDRSWRSRPSSRGTCPSGLARRQRAWAWSWTWPRPRRW